MRRLRWQTWRPLVGPIGPVTWIHWSPNEIAVGDYVVPPVTRGVIPTTLGEAWENAVRLGLFDPNRVYVMAIPLGGPILTFSRLTVCRRDYFCYEVLPEDIGLDTDPGQRAMRSWSCSRARVCGWLHAPTDPKPGLSLDWLPSRAKRVELSSPSERVPQTELTW